MIEWFTETRGRTRLIWGVVLLLVSVGLFFAGVIWFFLWAVAAVLVLSSPLGAF